VQALDTSVSTVYRTRQRLVEDGLDAALRRRPREQPSIPRIFDGETEARLIQLACSEAPAGYARWTLRLLEEKVVELGIVARGSNNTIGRTLKKHSQAAPFGSNDSTDRRRIRHRAPDGLSFTAHSGKNPEGLGDPLKAPCGPAQLFSA
jgi:Homeodomain-like domain